MKDAKLLANRYQLIDQLGAGSMGAVYRAVDRLTGGILALKRVTVSSRHLRFASRVMLDEDTTRRQDTLRLALAQEFKTLAGLRHPHIISVIDYGFDEERRPFFTMLLLEDAQHLTAAGHEQPLETQVEYLSQTLQAVAYLHQRGILHRDIKPGNVLVTKGRVRVLDFGLSIERKTAQQRVGTASYMAPETIRTGQASAASDLYAVGTLAYEMWAGHHPFNTGSKRLLMDILSKAPDVSLLPEPVRPVVARLLAKDSAERYTDAGDAIQALSAAIGQPAPEESAAIRESFLQAAAFVGRDGELGQLTCALEKAARGSGSAWLVGGESGVGKSRLLDELRTQALVGGAAVLRGQAVEEGGQAYQLWCEPLRHMALMTELSNLEAGVIKPLVPDIHTLLSRTIPDVPDLGEANQQRLHLTIAGICQATAQQIRPLVLLLEDLHWASESLEPLKFLSRLAADLPLLVIGSYRSEEHPDLPTECPNMQALSLARLSPESIAALSASMLGSAGEQPQVLDLLEKETEGNTFFVVETVRALAEEAGRLDAVGQMTLPEEVSTGGVQRIIQHRLARVPVELRPLLKLAAVAGRSLDLAVLQASMPQVDIETWLSTCANVVVLEVREGTWRFAHDKLRKELIAGLDGEERSVRHCQVAEAYEKVYPDDPSHAAALTSHWEAAGRRKKACHYACAAGEYAVAQYANDDAVRYFSRALALMPEHDAAEKYGLYLVRGEVYGRLGQREAQVADLDQLGALASTLDQQIAIALRYGTYYNEVGEYESAVATSNDAYRWAAENDDGSSQAQAMIISGQAFMQQGDYETARQHYQRAYELADATAIPSQIARAWSGLGEVAFRQGDYPGATQYHHQTLRLWHEIHDQPGQAESLRNLGQVVNAQGDYETARSHLLGALQLARQMGDRPREGRLLLDLGGSDWRQGHYQQAEGYFRRSLTLAQTTGDRRTVAASLRNLGSLAAQQGLLRNATGYWKQSLAIAQQIGDRAGEGSTLNNLGLAAERRGQYDKALSYYEPSLAIKQEIGDRYGASGTLSNLGRVATHQGQYDKAIGYFEQSLAIAQEIGNRAGEGITLHNLGYLAYCQRMYDKAMDYYEQSLIIKHDIGSRDVASITLNHLGAVALAQSAFQQAQAYYEQAFATHKQLNQPHYLLEDLAGLALVALHQEDLRAAAKYTGQFLEDWPGNPTLEGAEQPILTLHFIWQVCQGLGLPQADEVLAAAAGSMQTCLDHHPDPETRAAYLSQPHHQALWTAWQARQETGDTTRESETSEDE